MSDASEMLISLQRREEEMLPYHGPSQPSWLLWAGHPPRGFFLTFLSARLPLGRKQLLPEPAGHLSWHCHLA